jgi:uncharacterized protein with HEPN domain
MTRKRQLRAADYLEHILEAIQRIENYVAALPDERAFSSNNLVQDAVIRNLELIGEAAHKARTANPELATRDPSIPWNLIYGMRNRILHGYFDINLEVVWRTVKNDLPPLRDQLHKLLQTSSNQGS